MDNILAKPQTISLSYKLIVPNILPALTLGKFCQEATNPNKLEEEN